VTETASALLAGPEAAAGAGVVAVTTTAPLIRMEGVTKTYDAGEIAVEALRGIDVEIERGQMVAVIGPSGSGKSTLMHILGCLDAPTDGTYRLKGRDVSLLSGFELAAIRNQEVGFVFQTFNLLPKASLLRNVELSGGQRQRAAIARALVNEPSLVLADEPTGNLDTKTGLEILEIFDRLHAKGETVVIVTHDPRIAERCERVVSIVDGRIEDDRRNR
jgi:putative ABC transport system ATP-binding protein